MLIRDKEQIAYIRSAMVRDVQIAIRQIEAIKRGDVTPVDGVPMLEQLERRVELATQIDAMITKDLKFKR